MQSYSHTHRVATTAPIVVAAIIAVALTGCTPSLAPLYRDFEAPAEQDSLDMALLETALVESGWTLADAEVETVVATAPRTIRRWGLYRVDVSLELAPLSGNYVRVFIHPYRVYFTGSRRKLPFLRRGHARAILPDLQRALADQGIESLGPVQRKDRVEEDRNDRRTDSRH